MQDAALLTYNALDADTTLLALLGGKVASKYWNRIYNDPVAPFAEELPRITLFEVINTDDVAADNDYLYSDVVIRINAWTVTSENFAIVSRVKTILKAAFVNMCTFRIEATMYETDTEVYHKSISMYLKIEQ